MTLMIHFMDHELMLMVNVVSGMLKRILKGLNMQKARLRGEP
ncbi:hypothetical protein VCEC0027_003069 [Vibrio cholerae O1 str. EC-0027]|nr:hypothetical protein VCHC61A1_3622 [Vibrio cholerae HC-61A1]EKL25133.1 hypothetical protein VCHC62A1_3063 [Vibrio cholerae HC-62A1]EKL84928.1 hypothetical protein VCHC17A2_3219 [Vibrio cholerae HC-17A2]EMQ09445.1 hypothetical protein VCEC0027_003069 [Vibrio cholerae O1 str. EC-0027]EMQ09692.1 hypothetical protein VCEC0012_002799 [Vibrio cholerae O1 str. EC-0012]